MMEHPTAPRLITGLMILSLALSGTACIFGGPKLPEALSRYLSALVAGDYPRAYGATDIERFASAPDGGAVTVKHFIDSMSRRPLEGYSVISYEDDPVIDLRYRDGETERVTFEMSNDLVLPDLSGISVTSRRGPIPGLSVDGIPTRITEATYHPRGVFGGRQDGWIHDYYLWFFPGSHRLEVPAGRFTLPARVLLAERADGEFPGEIRIPLRPNARAAAAGRAVVKRWARAKQIPKDCESFDSLAINPRTVRVGRGPLVEAPDDDLREGAWTVRVPVHARGIDTSVGFGDILAGAFFAPLATAAAAPGIALECGMTFGEDCTMFGDIMNSFFAPQDAVKVTINFAVILDEGKPPRLADACPFVTRTPA